MKVLSQGLLQFQCQKQTFYIWHLNKRILPGDHFIVGYLDAVSLEQGDGRFAGRVTSSVLVVVDHADEDGLDLSSGCGHQQSGDDFETNLTSLENLDLNVLIVNALMSFGLV